MCRRDPGITRERVSKVTEKKFDIKLRLTAEDSEDLSALEVADWLNDLFRGSDMGEVLVMRVAPSRPDFDDEEE